MAVMAFGSKSSSWDGKILTAARGTGRGAAVRVRRCAAGKVWQQQQQQLSQGTLIVRGLSGSGRLFHWLDLLIAWQVQPAQACHWLLHVWDGVHGGGSDQWLMMCHLDNDWSLSLSTCSVQYGMHFDGMYW
jgi:hypothetical protein